MGTCWLPSTACVVQQTLVQRRLLASPQSRGGARRLGRTWQLHVGTTGAGARKHPNRNVLVQVGQEQEGATSPVPHPTNKSAASPPLPHLYGSLCILMVAVLWGTYPPAIRLAYELPSGPSPVALNAVRGLLQCALLLVANLVWPAQQQQPQTGDGAVAAAEGANYTEASRGGEGRNRKQQQQQQQQQQQDEAMPPGWWRELLASVPPAVLGGIEIGLYNTMGTVSQAVGLAYTTATKGAFLIQATTIFTPVLVAAMGSNPRPNVWVGSLLALAGAVVVALEGSGGVQGAVSGAASSLVGDALTVFAALSYSMATVRLGAYTREVSPLPLALATSVTLAAVSLALLLSNAGVLLLQGGAGAAALGQLLPYSWEPQAWGVIVYLAVGPGALATFLQVKGQSLISPTEAQILFSTVPLWSVLCAALLLHEPAGGLFTYLGGAAMVAAGVVSAL